MNISGTDNNWLYAIFPNIIIKFKQIFIIQPTGAGCICATAAGQHILLQPRQQHVTMSNNWNR